jgi:molybdopterin-guanine dinucleotide biosynthesis protein B
MNVVGFAAYSGAGKTTLVEALIPRFVARGLRVAVIKHAHHRFDVDTPGKDSWRHRKAGASEVLVVSDVRMALMREFAEPGTPPVRELIAQIDPSVDWLLVEGFRGSDLPKVEIWRAPSADFAGHPARYPDDPAIRAIATDAPGALPAPTALPLLALNDPDAVLAWLLDRADAFAYPASARD